MLFGECSEVAQSKAGVMVWRADDHHVERARRKRPESLDAYDLYLRALPFAFTAMPQEPGWRQSQVVPVLLPGAQWLRGWLPEWAAQRIDFGSTP